MAYLTNLARAYREKQYEIKTAEIQSFIGAANSPTSMVTIVDGGRNVPALDIEMLVNANFAGAQVPIANSKASDMIQRLEILYPSGEPYMYFLNYGVAADNTTKPFNRYAIYWYNDADAVSADDAFTNLGGAGAITYNFRILLPCGIPAGKGFRIRFFFNPVTVGWAANVSITSIVINLTPLTTDAPVDMMEIQCQSVANIVGNNNFNDKLPSGKPLAGFLLQLVTTTEPDVTRIFLKKSGAVFLDQSFPVYARQVGAGYVPARLTGELLIFFDAVIWDLSGIFNFVVNANAGTFRFVTFHPVGSAGASPGVQASAAGKQAPAALSGGQVYTQTAPTNAPSASPAAIAVPGSYKQAIQGR